MCSEKAVVLKFGGSALAAAANLATALRLTHEENERGKVVVVVSAVAGVTDTLEACLEGARSGHLDVPRLAASIGERHRALLASVADGPVQRAADGALTKQLAALEGELLGLRGVMRVSPAVRATVLGAGERLMAPVFVAGLRSLGLAAELVDGAEIVRTEGGFEDAVVDFEKTRTLVACRFGAAPAPSVVVVTGFVASTPSGGTTLLGRGGSDLTATTLALALGARRVEIWSNVDGLLTADPRKVVTAGVLPELAWSEAEALARGGARILHPATMEPAARGGFPVLIRNILAPALRGSSIGDHRTPCTTPARALASTADDALARIFVLAGREADLAGSVRRALTAEGLHPRTIEDAAHGVVVTVPVASHGTALRLLHAALVRPLPIVSIALAGPNGRVGQAFRAQLSRHAAGIAARSGLELRLVATFGRTRAVFAPEGLHPDKGAASLTSADPTPWAETIDLLLSYGPRPLVLVDATASEELTSFYARLLEGGAAIVTPNKRANARSLHEYRRLARLAERGVPFLYGTTVGAGLPVLREIRDLTRAGDRLRSIRAVLSGTLSFVLSRVQDGIAFGDAVEEAQQLGLTEPDPREDLSGLDVLRKLLVMLRDAGLAVEAADVHVDPLSLDEDERWRQAAQDARERGARLAHVARWDESGCRIGVEAVAEDDVLARVRPGENVVVLTTDRYSVVPLTFSGPGAGPDITAGNLFSELATAAEALAGPGRDPAAAAG